MIIEYLADNPAYAVNAAGWIYHEFIKDIRHDISYEQICGYYRRLGWRLAEICVDEFGLTTDVFKFAW